MNLNEQFDILDDNLKLDPEVRQRAVVAHNRLGELLVEAGVAKRTRLQGSFARHTMRGPELHDIDKVVELVDSLHAPLEGSGGSEKAMEIIHSALAPHFSSARFEVKKHALGIYLPGDGFNFDAVPAFNPEDGTGWIAIADTEDDAWEPSNTYVLIDTIAERNQACDGRFVRQVRMAKQAVHHAGLYELLPGLHIETFAYQSITGSTSHSQAVAATLSMGARLLGGPYTDPTGVDRISDRLSPADVVTAQREMERSAGLAAEAERLAARGDEASAERIWAGIFGEMFPHPKEGEKRFLQGLHAGASVGPAVISRPTPPTRAWRPA